MFIFIVCNFKDKLTKKDSAVPDLDLAVKIFHDTSCEDSDLFKSYIFVRKSNDEMDKVFNASNTVLK